MLNRVNLGPTALTRLSVLIGIEQGNGLALAMASLFQCLNVVATATVSLRVGGTLTGRNATCTCKTQSPQVVTGSQGLFSSPFSCAYMQSAVSAHTPDLVLHS